MPMLEGFKILHFSKKVGKMALVAQCLLLGIFLCTFAKGNPHFSENGKNLSI